MYKQNKIDLRETLPTEINSERVILRKPNLKDAKNLSINGNEKELNYLTYYLPYPFGEKEAKKIILEDKTNKELVRFAVELKKAPVLNFHQAQVSSPHLHAPKQLSATFLQNASAGGNVIGLIDLYNWKVGERKVKLGYWIGKDYRRKGYVSEIMPGILDFAFNKMGVQKITAKVLIDNVASQKLLEKFKFVKIKTTPGDKFLDGKRVDTISYELIKE